MSRIKSFYPYFRDTLFAILIIFFLPSKADVSSLEKKMARIMTDQQKQISHLHARTETQADRIGNLEDLRIAHNTDLKAHSE